MLIGVFYPEERCTPILRLHCTLLSFLKTVFSSGHLVNDNKSNILRFLSNNYEVSLKSGKH